MSVGVSGLLSDLEGPREGRVKQTLKLGGWRWVEREGLCAGCRPEMTTQDTLHVPI